MFISQNCIHSRFDRSSIKDKVKNIFDNLTINKITSRFASIDWNSSNNLIHIIVIHEGYTNKFNVIVRIIKSTNSRHCIPDSAVIKHDPLFKFIWIISHEHYKVIVQSFIVCIGIYLYINTVGAPRIVHSDTLNWW